MQIPLDIHERVVALTDAILNACEEGDDDASAALYAELHAYCDAVALAGRDHPFLWETLADFTSDDHAAIDHYTRALMLATAAKATTYEASICLALAERHSNLGDLATAQDYALLADALAQRTDDLPLRKAISQFLLDHSQPGERA
ncbi:MULTISPECIES: hypothetical protein [unclassified Stenotrophomonas]|uniref:hypothetical protein n=1 Tax=unclassified Stenotrophomonas TaxID=196198 RepID=UPI0025F07849|nr:MULTISPECIES: hypothetical protein [unclassified Stenotrophomonas]